MSRGRSNYLELKARLGAIWVMVFPEVAYIAPATRAATNSGSSALWSSSLAALHGKMAIRMSLAEFEGQEQKEDGKFYPG